MRERQFSLLPSHLSFTHDLWHKHCKVGDTAIDCTCGNGHDTLALAQMILSKDKGKLYAIDVQLNALDSTRQLLAKKLEQHYLDRIEFVHGCHSKLPITNQANLIVYNLGYLPGGDKQLTTLIETTLKSIEEALTLLKQGGVISLTCYPGHPQGAEEELILLDFCKKLPSNQWCVTHHRWHNRHLAPSVILIEKNL